MEHTFTTHEPVRLYVEIGSGSLSITAAETTTTTIELSGGGAEGTEVTQDGSEIAVLAPKDRTSFLGRRDNEVHARIEVPIDSQVISQTGSAHQQMAGRLRMVRAQAGSGDIEVEHATEVLTAQTGSGSIEVDTAGSDARLKAGSGDITVRVASGTLGVSTGSGDVVVEHTESDAVVKTGSGDIRVGTVRTALRLTTGSGSADVALVERGAVHAKTGSGDLRLGVAAGIPVWTDISTSSGRISSDLDGAGEPEPGQEHVELRARTGSGDIDLVQK